ncbi:MAG: DUF1858 domain-containing protein [Bacteroidota bacterium]
MIRRDILIEDLVTVLPESVRYLMNKGIRPIVCGEPLWDTLEGAARHKGMSDQQIDAMVTDLADIAAQKNQVKKG